MDKIRRNKFVLGILFVVAAFIAITTFVCLLTSNTKHSPKTSEKADEVKSPDSKMAKEHIPSLQPCMGNTDSQCPTPPSIDFYPSGSENSFNPLFDRRNQNRKEMGGKIIAINGKSVELQTSDDKIFTINFPINAVDEWNASRSPNYDDYKVGIGDTLMIRYGETNEQSSRSITPTQIMTSVLVVRLTSDEKVERF